MNCRELLSQLMAERSRLDDAITALQRLSGETATTAANGRRRKRHMSAEAKKRISEMMKKRWAERKKLAKSA